VHLMSKLRFDVISIFPEYLSPLKLSLIGKAQESGLIDIAVHDLRDKAEGVHKSVDDTPYGGGAGMVMSPEPWAAMIDDVIAASSAQLHDLIILTPAGQKLTQKLAEELSRREHLILHADVMKELMIVSDNITKRCRMFVFVNFLLVTTY